MAEAETKSINLKIQAPFKVYYEGQASSISAVNATGPFDILPGHKNFITLVKQCTVRVRQESKDDFTLDINHGVMHVRANQVVLFLDI